MKCSRKNCDNDALGYITIEEGFSKKQVNRCEFHQADYLEKKRTKLEQSMSSSEIKADAQKHGRVKDIKVVRQPQIQQAHGSNLINNINARLDEIYA